MKVNPQTELLALKRGSINKGYKYLTINEAYRMLLRLESSSIHRYINTELDRIEKRRITNGTRDTTLLCT